MNKMNQVTKNVIENVVSRRVNTACCLIVYQPKLPKGAEKFKKF